MKDFLCILVCFFIILCLFMVVVYYTGAFWVKVFKFVYRFSEKYWLYIRIVIYCVGIIIEILMCSRLLIGH